MRSEKEIREIIERKKFWVNEEALKRKLIEEILGGEPRYSVAELEKIFPKAIINIMDRSSVLAFFDFLKDSKKVKKVLK